MKTIIITIIVLCFLSETHSQETIKLYNITENRKTDFPEDLYLPYTEISNVELNPLFNNKSLYKTGDRLKLELFEDNFYMATIDRVNTNVNGTLSVRAILDDYLMGYLIISITEDKVLATISIPETQEMFSLKTNYYNNLTYLKKLDVPKLDILESGPDLILPFKSEIDDEEIERLKRHTTNKDNEVANVDVMIVYTPAAEIWANTNDGSVFNTVAQSMEIAQLALDNSETLMNMTLVYSGMIDYVESGNSVTDLSRLTFHEGYDPWDYEGYPWYMEEVHNWREVYGADLVAIFAQVNDVGGLGWLLTNRNGWPELGFSLTRIQQASSSVTHIHEMGHNMGCHHHKQQSSGPGPTAWSNWSDNTWSAGWRWKGSDDEMYCGVMTYNSGQYFSDGINAVRVLYFSNPNLFFMDVEVGHEEDGDNARTLREVRHVIASYMEEKSPESYVLSIVKNPQEGGIVEGAGEHTEGILVNMSATPATGHILVDWVYDDGTFISDEESFEYFMPDYDATVYANFSLAYDVTFEVKNTSDENIGNAQITFDETTNLTGFYVFPDIIPGTYNYYVTSSGYDSVSGTIEVDDEDVVVNVVMDQEATFTDAVKDINLAIYPNPAKDKLIIEAEKEIRGLKVFSLSGKAIKNLSVYSPYYVLNTSNLNKGLYFIQIQFEDNIITRRISIIKD